MISDEVWDKVREAWRETIPEQYRFTDKERGIASQQDPHFSSAIILPPLPAHMLASFFAQFTPHLTKAQLAARAARENCGRPGVRKGEPWTPPPPQPIQGQAFSCARSGWNPSAPRQSPSCH